jgi:hypothetical protein
MKLDTTAARSRRSLLAGIAAGVAAVAAKTLAGAERVIAAPGSDGLVMHVGQEFYDARTMLYVHNGTNDNYVIAAQSTAGGIALSGVSNTADGVSGVSSGSGGVGVRGVGKNYALGVYGESNNVGVEGKGLGSATGVIGVSSSGVGVSAQSSSGKALAVHGSAYFSRSGTATIGVGTKTKQVRTGDLTADDRVFCTLDTNQAGLSLVSILKDYQAGAVDYIRITLSAKVAAGKYAKVYWIVFDDLI